MIIKKQKILKKNTFPFGIFLKKLREKKEVSLKKVEEDTKIPNAYLSLLETGKRRKIPDSERLRILADYYNVSVKELLTKAGYFDQQEIGETYEQKLKKAFLHIISDPKFKYGIILNARKYDLDSKKFIIEMYEKLTGNEVLK